jgi:hypothetical protein
MLLHHDRREQFSSVPLLSIDTAGAPKRSMRGGLSEWTVLECRDVELWGLFRRLHLLHWSVGHRMSVLHIGIGVESWGLPNRWLCFRRLGGLSRSLLGSVDQHGWDRRYTDLVAVRLGCRSSRCGRRYDLRLVDQTREA